MKNGYKILWTDNALSELKIVFEYLERNWTEKELRKLANEIEKTIHLISNNPTLFQKSNNRNVRRAVILKLNSMYYRIKNDETVEILSFFSNRQNPNKNKYR